jgi:hypothetical protein
MVESRNKSWRSRLDSVVTVIVGSEEAQETFVLHESVLRQNSDFFNNALNGGWKEAQEQAVKISEVKPARFAIFAKFILTGLLFIQSDGDIATVRGRKWNKAALSCRTATLDTISRLFMLASLLQAPDFQDAILDIFIETVLDYRALMKGNFAFLHNRIQIVHNHTAADSPYRKFFVDINLHSWLNGGCLKGIMFAEYPPQFCHDFMHASLPFLSQRMEAAEMPDPADLSRSCQYHEHTKRGQPCYKEKYSWTVKGMHWRTTKQHKAKKVRQRHGGQQDYHIAKPGYRFMANDT